MTSRLRNSVAACLALALLLLFLGGGWLRNPPPRLLDMQTNLPASGEVPVGTELVCQIRLATSWRRGPERDLRIALPEGVALAPAARLRFQTLSWGETRWHLLLRLLPCRPGPVAGGGVVVRCGKGKAATELAIELPRFSAVVPPLDSAALEAAPLPKPDSRPSGLAWILVAGAVALFWIWRRRRPMAPQATPEGGASLLDRLEALRARLDRPDAEFFAALGDLVAESLQASHGIPATALTQREQAAWLAHSHSLDAGLAERLGRFWSSAELVRFAGGNASPEQAREAVAAAAGLLARSGGRQA